MRGQGKILQILEESGSMRAKSRLHVPLLHHDLRQMQGRLRRRQRLLPGVGQRRILQRQIRELYDPQLPEKLRKMWIGICRYERWNECHFWLVHNCPLLGIIIWMTAYALTLSSENETSAHITLDRFEGFVGRLLYRWRVKYDCDRCRDHCRHIGRRHRRGRGHLPQEEISAASIRPSNPFRTRTKTIHNTYLSCNSDTR